MLRNIKIGHRLWGSFGLLLLITLITGIIAIQSLHKLSGIASDIYTHPVAVINTLRNIRNNVFAIRAEVNDIALAETDEELEHSLIKIDNLEKEMLQSFSIIQERYLGSQADVDKAIELIRNWRDIRDEWVLLARNKQQTKLIAIIKGEGARHVDEIHQQMEKLIRFANKKAAEFLENSKIQRDQTITFMISILGFLILSSILIAHYITRGITAPLKHIKDTATAIAGGELDTDLGLLTGDEIGQLAKSINHMQASLREAQQQQLKTDWHKDGLARLNSFITGNPTMVRLTSDLIVGLCHQLNAQLGTIYILDHDAEPPVLNFTAGFGYIPDSTIQSQFRIGEGLIGQAAEEKQPILVSDPPAGYIKIRSSLGDSPPNQLAVFPCYHEETLMAVIEIGLLRPLSESELAFLNEALLAVGIAIEAAETREDLQVALITAQHMTEESQAQQVEMEALNEELEEQNQMLHSEQRKVELAQQELKTQAENLAMASRYKSEFLANMSHELRTPLNSLLLLSRGLADNKDKSLREDQVQSAQIIYQSGHDLLDLINEVLDLSKIEAGRMELNVETMRIEDLAGSIQANFKHLTDEKALSLEVALDSRAPKTIRTDRKRLEQVVKNLLSNAIKFTNKGGIKVTFTIPSDRDRYALALKVTDTGIGIPEDQQERVFEAFRQADGSSSRKFGGTGLGLSISRELADLLGGEIQLQSKPDEGSTFTILLPLQAPSIKNVDELYPPLQIKAKTKQVTPDAKHVADDRNEIKSGDRSILIVEDDLAFLNILIQESRKHNFKCLASTTGENALKLAIKYKPNAVILDLMLPGMNGWQVLDQLKQNMETRHIPVHIASILDPDYSAMRNGAVGYLQKPASQEGLENVLARLDRVVDSKTRNLLVVEDDKASRHAITQLIGNGVVKIDEAETGAAALKALRENQYDCVILDLGLPDMDGHDLLKKMATDNNIDNPPVVIYTGRELSHDEELKLRDYSDSIIIKDVRSEERLLDEVSLFLHRVIAELPDSKREKIERLYNTDELLKDKKILVVDDDMRTLFAVTRVLSEYGMDVIKADGGESALELLAATPDMDLILMDIMMPGLDGYQTIERIRSQQQFKSIPIIALTAKAMPEDRQKCLDAGANDYMTKPIEPISLVSLLRIWLYR